MAENAQKREYPAHTAIQYQYSIPIPPQVYEGEDYFCLFPPRVHRDNVLADEASWQCQVDFLEANGAFQNWDRQNKEYRSPAVGCINPRVGNFTSLCACEALPERLALTSYTMEYTVIHDDCK